MFPDFAACEGHLGSVGAHATIAEGGTVRHGQGVTHLPRGRKRIRDYTNLIFAESSRCWPKRLHIACTFPSSISAEAKSHAPMMLANQEGASGKRATFMRGAHVLGFKFARTIKRAEIVSGNLRSPTGLPGSRHNDGGGKGIGQMEYRRRGSRRVMAGYP